jgi:hypothetical protein
VLFRSIINATIKFNGSEREKKRGPLFWRKVQPALYFNRTPRKNIYVYSFAQHPSSWFPSGSVNLSRIDRTQLDFTLPTTDANGAAYGEANAIIFADNFNVLRVQGGMAAKKLTIPPIGPHFACTMVGTVEGESVVVVVVRRQIAGFQKYSARGIRALPRGNPVGLTTAAVAA